MAFIRRLSSALLQRRMILSPSSLCSRNAFSTDEKESPLDNEQELENINRIRFAGIVVNSKPQDQSPYIVVQHYGSIKSKIFASPDFPKVKALVRTIEVGMNIAVEGSLGQHRAVKKEGEQFNAVKETFIKADRIEILATPEQVESKYEERRNRSQMQVKGV